MDNQELIPEDAVKEADRYVRSMPVTRQGKVEFNRAEQAKKKEEQAAVDTAEAIINPPPFKGDPLEILWELEKELSEHTPISPNAREKFQQFAAFMKKLADEVTPNRLSSKHLSESDAEAIKAAYRSIQEQDERIAVPQAAEKIIKPLSTNQAAQPAKEMSAIRRVITKPLTLVKNFVRGLRDTGQTPRTPPAAPLSPGK